LTNQQMKGTLADPVLCSGVPNADQDMQIRTEAGTQKKRKVDKQRRGKVHDGQECRTISNVVISTSKSTLDNSPPEVAYLWVILFEVIALCRNAQWGPDGTVTCTNELGPRSKLDLVENFLIAEWIIKVWAAMKRYIWNVSVVPIEGEVKAPGVVTATHIRTLMTDEGFNDAIIDAYLALIYHTHNGHLDGVRQLGPHSDGSCEAP